VVAERSYLLILTALYNRLSSILNINRTYNRLMTIKFRRYYQILSLTPYIYVIHLYNTCISIGWLRWSIDIHIKKKTYE